MKKIAASGSRNAVSTTIAIVAIIVIIVVVAGGVLLLSPHGIGTVTTTSSSTSSATTSSLSPATSSSLNTSPSTASTMSGTSGATSNSSTSSTHYSGELIASFADPNTPLGAPNINMTYPLAVNGLGNLPSSVDFQQTRSQGITLSFSPSNITLGTSASTVQVQLSVAQNVSAGNYNVQTVATGGGGSFNISLSVQVVKYLVGIEPAFTPGNLTVPQGSIVTWIRTNGELGEHGSNGSQDIVFNNGMVKSPQLLQWQSWSYTFNQTGSYPYICTYQVGESGEVTVVAG